MYQLSKSVWANWCFGSESQPFCNYSAFIFSTAGLFHLCITKRSRDQILMTMVSPAPTVDRLLNILAMVMHQFIAVYTGTLGKSFVEAISGWKSHPEIGAVQKFYCLRRFWWNFPSVCKLKFQFEFDAFCQNDSTKKLVLKPFQLDNSSSSDFGESSKFDPAVCQLWLGIWKMIWMPQPWPWSSEWNHLFFSSDPWHQSAYVMTCSLLMENFNLWSSPKMVWSLVWMVLNLQIYAQG